MRGYLWTDLTGDVMEEFGAFTNPPSRRELDAGGFQVKQYSQRVAPPAQPAVIRSRRFYARSVIAGQCVKGAHPARPGKRTCAACSAAATERNRINRKKRAA